MKKHSNKGRLLLAQAILMDSTISIELQKTAIDCLLAYKRNDMKKLYIYIKETKEVEVTSTYEYNSENKEYDTFTMYIRKNGKIKYLKLIELLNVINNFSSDNRIVVFPILYYEKEPLDNKTVHKLVESLLSNCIVEFKKSSKLC